MSSLAPGLAQPAGSCAVVVVDKQRAYLCREHSMWGVGETEWVAGLDAFVSAARDAGARIVFTRMTESLEQSPANIREVMRSTGTPTLTEPGSAGFQWFGETPGPGDLIVDKEYYDAFAHTGLRSRLTEWGVTTVVLVGAFAGRCVLATAFGANARGFRVLLVPEFVIGHPESPHEWAVATETVGSILGWLVGGSELLSAWRRVEAGEPA